MAVKNLINVEVLTPDRVLYKGQAEAISGINDKGKFDVLSYHSRFISLLDGEMTIVIDKKTQRKIVFANKGVVRVFDNLVKVYLQEGAEIKYELGSKEYGEV